MFIEAWVFLAMLFLTTLLFAKLYMINVTVRGITGVGTRLELVFWVVVGLVLLGGASEYIEYRYALPFIIYLSIRAISTITEIVWLSRTFRNKKKKRTY